MLKKHHSKLLSKGFTIVELLIVIVVIAILAAISVVAYNGIQTRAENTKTSSAAAEYVKLVRLYKTDNGKYPLVDSTPANTLVNYCLGPDGTSCGMVSSTTFDNSCDYVGAANSSATLNNLLKKYTSSLPEVSKQNMRCINRDVRGAIYFQYNDTVIIRYYLKGDQSCPAVSGTTIVKRPFAPETTSCELTLTS